MSPGQDLHASARTGPWVSMEEVLMDAARFFRGDSDLHRAALALARRLEELNVPFALAGGLALAGYGYRRMTEDVDVLVRPADWQAFKQRWLGLGYREVFAGSKGVRDTEHGVKIDVLYTGDFPGDGKPGPVAFPDPTDAAAVSRTAEVPVVTLETLVTLKLASGKTAPGRRFKDYADVVELIRANRLDESFAARLDPYVRPVYLELLVMARAPDQPPEG